MKLFATDIDNQRTSGPPVRQYCSWRIAPFCRTSSAAVRSRRGNSSVERSMSRNV